MDEANGLLPEDKLTMFCEVCVHNYLEHSNVSKQLYALCLLLLVDKFCFAFSVIIFYFLRVGRF